MNIDNTLNQKHDKIMESRGCFHECATRMICRYQLSANNATLLSIFSSSSGRYRHLSIMYEIKFYITLTRILFEYIIQINTSFFTGMSILSIYKKRKE